MVYALERLKTEMFKMPEIHSLLVNIFKFAAKHNCKYIYIDRDGPMYEELERFEW